MLTLKFDPLVASGNSVLCLGAHADDIEIGCGGSVLHLVARFPDLTVDWVVLSADGVRHDEAQRTSGRFLSNVATARVTIEMFRDRYFPADGRAMKEFFDALGERVNPDLIFTHRRDDMHQDHRAIAELTYQTFRDHLILEYEIPKFEGDLGQPNVFVPLTRDACERKAAIIQAGYPSQHGHPWFTEETFISLARLRGIESRAPAGYAEGFHCRKMVLS